MTTPEDPWADLDVAPNGAVSAKRVDEQTPWNIYWARDSDGRRLLLMRYTVPAPQTRLPSLKGLEVQNSPSDHAGPAQLVLRLMDHDLRDVFARLCRDIVEYTSKASAETEAINAMIARTWRWHHLLRGGGSQRLSREEQKGLLAELLVLDSYLIPAVGVFAAIASWRGPSGAPQDFVHLGTGLESKARGTGDTHVKISSEFQLDDARLDAIFIHVTTIDPAPREEPNAYTVTEFVERLRVRVRGDSAAQQRFEGLLSAAGFRDEDDYSAETWRLTERGILKVDDRLPRIVASRLKAGISDVQYQLDLSRCDESLVGPDALMRVLKAQT